MADRAAVLICPEEFENWKETKSILSDSDLMKEIRNGPKALKARAKA